DAMRVWHLVKSGVGLSDSAKAVLIDRARGLLGMMVLVAATTPGIYLAIKDGRMWNAYLALVAVGTAGVIGFLVLGYVRLPQTSSRPMQRVSEFVTVSRYVAGNPKHSVQ